jgi:hypothetical protein
MNSPQAMSDENSVGARRIEPGTIVVVVYDSLFGGIVEPAADSGGKNSWTVELICCNDVIWVCAHHHRRRDRKPLKMTKILCAAMGVAAALGLAPLRWDWRRWPAPIPARRTPRW